MTESRHYGDVPTPTSELYRLADLAMPGGVAAWLADRRGQARPVSWRKLVIELVVATGISVSTETLRTWDAALNGASDESVPA